MKNSQSEPFLILFFLCVCSMMIYVEICHHLDFVIREGDANMGRLQTAIHPFLGTKAFYRDALSVMIPVTIQQLINNLFNMADSLMVGSLDINGLAISAVTVANKPYIVFFGVFFGLSGASGLMLSQYYGAGDRKTCQSLFSLQMILGFLNALLFGAVLYIFPEQTMKIFVSDARTVEMGVRYLRIVCFSYVPVAVSSTCIFSLRSLGMNKISMLVSLVAMCVNVVVNFTLIFGKFGFPSLGVEGAAIGTVTARIIEMLIYAGLLLRKRMYFSTDMLAFSTLKRSIANVFARKAIPLICNELLWSMGLNIFFWCYAKLNEAAVPAITIAEQSSQIAAVMAMGTSSAVSVLIGTELGAGRLQNAKDSAKKLLSLVVVIGLIGTLLTAVLGFALPGIFTLSEELRKITTQMTCIFAMFAPINFVYGFCFFCMRAGGDTKNATLLDSGYMWLIPVPACFIIGNFFPGRMDVIFAVILIQLLAAGKMFPGLWLLKKGAWVRNITQP